MSIRLRFTLLYNVILALTLAIFGFALYSIQSGVTYNALKKDITLSSERASSSVLAQFTGTSNQIPTSEPSPESPPPVPFEDFSGDPTFQQLSERDIVRVLDASGNLVASPFGLSGETLPLSAEGLQALQNQSEWWETATYQDQSMLIYSRPIVSNGRVVYILQVARSLQERNTSLSSLATILLGASLLTILVAFGIGWVFSGITFQPIKRLTQSAQTIGEERDFTRRVAYTGPQDEVGQLAATLNSMLSHLQDAYHQVARSLEMQRNFVADVSHELRTPLTTLRGNLGLLQRDPPIPVDEQADILGDMTDESDRLIRLVNGLLVLARADAGKSLIEETVTIQSVLEETCSQAHLLDPQRSITLVAGDLSIKGDRDALKQVLLILLDNALKHSAGSILVSAERKGEQIEIRVQDRGEGISPEKLKHVFDRFYRGGDDVTIPGFGLGLPIAKALVEGQGGSIKMESKLGKGSVVSLLFPGVDSG